MDLQRVEIATGKREEIFPAAPCLCTTSVSPDEPYAARVLTGEPLTLVVKDLDSGTEAAVTLPPEYFQAWEMVWAPDASAMLLSVWGFEWVTDAFAELYIDTADLTVDTLTSNDEGIMQPVAWEVMDTIWLNDGKGILWRMDAESKTLTLAASEARVISHSRQTHRSVSKSLLYPFMRCYNTLCQIVLAKKMRINV